jgi:hypothetical protein
MRDQVQTRQVGLRRDPALGQALDRPVAVGARIEANRVDEPAAPLRAASLGRRLDALDPRERLLVEVGDPAAARQQRVEPLDLGKAQR